MAEVIGQSPEVGKTVSCDGCGALIRYYKNDIKEIKINWDYLGDYDVVNAIECPQCQENVRLN